jgi:hypothetical protein
MTKEKIYITEIDCSTGIQSEREMTEEEYINYENAQAEMLSAAAEREAEANALAEAKASANAKLAALGLSEAEIAAILGK